MESVRNNAASIKSVYFLLMFFLSLPAFAEHRTVSQGHAISAHNKDANPEVVIGSKKKTESEMQNGNTLQNQDSNSHDMQSYDNLGSAAADHDSDSHDNQHTMLLR